MIHIDSAICKALQTVAIERLHSRHDEVDYHIVYDVFVLQLNKLKWPLTRHAVEYADQARRTVYLICCSHFCRWQCRLSISCMSLWLKFALSEFLGDDIHRLITCVFCRSNARVVDIILFLFCGMQDSLHSVSSYTAGLSAVSRRRISERALAMSLPEWPLIVSGHLDLKPCLVKDSIWHETHPS